MLCAAILRPAVAGVETSLNAVPNLAIRFASIASSVSFASVIGSWIVSPAVTSVGSLVSITSGSLFWIASVPVPGSPPAKPSAVTRNAVTASDV